MEYKILTTILICMILLPTVMAGITTLPMQKQYTCIDLPQICSTCNYVNMSSIKYPNSTVYNINSNMTKIGSNFNYTFCGTSELGKYLVTTCGDKDGYYQCAIYDFEITPTGEDRVNSLGIFIILVMISLLVLVFGLIMKNGFIGAVSGFLFLVTGVYSMMYGIGNLADLWTRSVAFVLIGIGIMLAISGGIGIIGDSGFGIGKGKEEDF